MNKKLQEIRVKLIIHTVENYKNNYDLTYQDISLLFSEGITKEGVRKIDLKAGQQKINQQLKIKENKEQQT